MQLQHVRLLMAVSQRFGMAQTLAQAPVTKDRSGAGSDWQMLDRKEHSHGKTLGLQWAGGRDVLPA
jgi:hypothetical protein